MISTTVNNVIITNDLRTEKIMKNVNVMVMTVKEPTKSGNMLHRIKATDETHVRVKRQDVNIIHVNVYAGVEKPENRPSFFN